MEDTLNRNIPACIRNDILMYQNRCLTRLVRELKRSRGGELRVIAKNSADFSGMNSENSSVDDLNQELRRVYCKLDRATVALLIRANEIPVEPPQTISSPQSADICQQESPDNLIELDRMRDELVELRASEALIYSLKTNYVDDSFINTLAEEVSFWKARCAFTETEIVTLRNGMNDRIETIGQSVSLTAQTYLVEVERMSEELARMQQEVHKLNGVISILNATKGEISVSSSNNFTTTSDFKDVHVSDSEQKLHEVTLCLKQCNERLRMKEELASRILAQHVQLQHLVKGLEQENAILRNQSGTLSVALEVVSKKMDSGCADMLSSVGLLAKLEKQCASETLINSQLLKDLDVTARETLELQGLNKQAQTAWMKLQEQTRTNLKHGPPKLSNTSQVEGSEGAQRGSFGSLVQLELDEIRAKIKCSLCQSRTKTVALTVCMHCFCRECVDEKMLNARNRKCPLCMQRFADADVRDIHFLNA